MSSVIKNYMVIILVIICIFTCVGIVNVAIDVHNARDFHGAVINEIESSNHASTVIDACEEAAEENGYVLTVTPYAKKNDTHAQISKVVLKYKYSILFLEVDAEKEIIGYAR